MKRNGGFTLLEVLLASSIAVLVSGSILTVYMMSNRTWSESSASIVLQSNGRLILDKIVRGPNGMYGLQEANYETVVIENNGTSIRYFVDKNEPPTYVQDDDTGCRFYLSNNQVWHDPDVSVEGDEYPLVQNGRVESINFIRTGSYITIELEMQDYASPRGDAYVKLRTNVFLRKARKVLH